MKFKRIEKKLIGFRKWTRKSYAAFNSLHLIIKICVLSISYALIKPSQIVKAQVDSTSLTKTTELEEVEISGQRSPVVGSQLTRIVTVLTKSEIEQAPVISVNDLLRQISLVDIRERGPNGAQADVSIQGGTFDETLILLNGINITDPQTGHYDLVLPLDIESVDRIEVLKGPASRVYGANAFSGAVNFITGLDTANHVKAAFTSGDFGLLRESLTANWHSNHYTDFISVSQGKSNGYIHNTDYNFGNAYYLGKVRFRQSTVTVQLGYCDNAYGANSFYSVSALSFNQYDHTDTYLASISSETVGTSIKFKSYAYWRRNYDHYEFIRQDPTYYQNYHFTDVDGGGVNATFLNTFGKTSIGIDDRNEIIHSTSLGFTTSDSIKVAGQNLYYNKMDSRTNLSIFAEHVASLSDLLFSVGLMANYNSKIGGIKIYPGSDISYRINNTVKAYISVNNSLRLPTFTDLYYLGPLVKGNRTLQPEQAWTCETGFKFGNRIVTGNVSYFHRWGRNIIDYVMYPGGSWNAVEYPVLNTNGVELAASSHPQDFIDKEFFIEQINGSFSFTSLSKSADTVTSNYALDNLRYKFVVGLNHRIYKNIKASWQLSYQKRNGFYGKYDSATRTLINTPYTPFFLLNGRIFYQYKWVTVYTEATNILNQTYVDLGNIYQPGRWFKAGISLDIR